MKVVDTNVIFPLIVRSAQTDAAIMLREHDPVWVTEPFALIEFSNILATYWRAGHVSRDKALEYLEIAQDFLEPNFVPVTYAKALDVAMRYGVTAYDARFLAVAETLGEKLITEDTRLRKAAPHLTQSIDEALKK